MKILAVSDKDDSKLQACVLKNMQFLQNIDLIVSCGDVSKQYLEFLVDNLKKPLFFVEGNHQFLSPEKDIPGNYLDNKLFDFFSHDKYITSGGINIHSRIENFNDFVFVGFEGSLRYNKGGFQYTQKEMSKIVDKIKSKIKLIRFFDCLFKRKRKDVIVVTHAPIKDIHDKQDLCHQGFTSFKKFVDEIKPVLWLHGHVHFEGQTNSQITKHDNTLVVNTYGFHIININDNDIKVVSNIQNLADY